MSLQLAVSCTLVPVSEIELAGSATQCPALVHYIIEVTAVSPIDTVRRVGHHNELSLHCSIAKTAVLNG